MQKFFIDNIKLLGENLKVLSEKMSVPFGGTIREIDILAFDTESFTPVIIELKKGEANEEVLLQVLRYASWARNNPDSIKYLLITKGGMKAKDIEESKDKLSDVRIIIVAEKFKNTLLSLSQYISTFQIDFVRYKRFVRKTPDGSEEYFIDIEYVTPPEEVYAGVSVSAPIKLEDYKKWIREDLVDLITGIYEEIVKIINEEGFDIRPRLYKWRIPFQVKGPINNILELRLKKTQPPDLALRFGQDFDPKQLDLDKEGIKLKQDKSYPVFYTITINSIEQLQKLPLKEIIKYLYEKYVS